MLVNSKIERIKESKIEANNQGARIKHFTITQQLFHFYFICFLFLHCADCTFADYFVPFVILTFEGQKQAGRGRGTNASDHFRGRADCRAPRRNEDEANFTTQDDDQTLLMVTKDMVLLNEEKVFPNVYAKDKSEAGTCNRVHVLFNLVPLCRLIPNNLDNGASNHMTGNREFFSELIEKTGRVKFGDGSAVDIKGKGAALMKAKRTQNRLYKINLQTALPICFLAKVNEKAWLWHARLSHLNFDALNKLTGKKMAEGVPLIDHHSQLYLCGPITPSTPPGNKYFLLLVDDFSKFMWVRILKTKDEAYGAFKVFKEAVEKEIGYKVKALRTDRGGEFTSTKFEQLCSEHGIKRILAAPYTQRQNGAVERRNQIVLGTTRSLLKTMKMPRWMWGEGSKAYRLYNPRSKRVVVSRDAKFEEDKPWSWLDELKEDEDWVDFSVENEAHENCVGITSRFMQAPKASHLQAIKQVLRYVKGTIDFGIGYHRAEGSSLVGYRPVAWSSQKQHIVALSSCEAEFMAAAATACQGVWLKGLLEEITGKSLEAITIRVDNKSAILLIKNPVFHVRSKHIHTKYHFIREFVENALVKVEYVSGIEQKADLLTKALPRMKFLEMRDFFGVKKLKTKIKGENVS
ncbi:hypothetical protein E3N88_23913 [Mikania micrantha]|uniref:Integrase catalytic domain-containing protein n=1 Tax=Mikania micrantha TaxID=192012 RepID=A0A5N6NEN7_9ASTR|nr:hypothetical protein E3N88_23913 [Mikania micrantha]